MSVSSEPIEVEERSKIKPYRTMRGHTDYVRGIARLPDRQHIITCSDDASLRLWNLESGVQIGNNWKEDGDDEGVLTMALSPNSKTVASGSKGGIVKLWDVETGKVTAKWTGHTDWVRSVRWSTDGIRVASGSQDGTVRVWGIESGQTVLGPIKTANERVYAVAYSPDSSNIASGGDNAMEIWDTTTGERLSTLEQDSPVWSLAWTSDQKKLIAGFENGSIRIFDTTTWEQIAILEGHTLWVNALSLFHNDRLLASASDDRTVHLWNLDTNLPVGPLQHQDRVWDAALSADGKSLVTGCMDKNAYVWDTLTILKDSGFEDLLSVLNDVAGRKSILDTDATRQPKKAQAAIPRSAFFDDTHNSVQSPNIPPALPPADIAPSVVHSDTPASTTDADSPAYRYRRKIFSSFSLSAARSLLRRVFPRPNVNSSVNLPEQPSSPPLVSVHEPADVQVPEATDNELDATHCPFHDQRHPQSIVDAQDRNHPSTTRTHPPPYLKSHRHGMSSSSRSSERPVLGRISGRIRGSHHNANEPIELHEFPAQRISSHHEPPIVEVPEAKLRMPIAGPRRPKPKPVKGNNPWWSYCICCARIPKKDGNKSTNSMPDTDVDRPAESSAHSAPT